MKPLTAGAGMNSTNHPKRNSPSPRTMNPHRNDKVVAIVGASQTPGWECNIRATMFPVCNDMTATGPIDTSFEVAKNYIEAVLERYTVYEKDTHTVNKDADER